jgi:hypothetical protein
MDFRIITRVEMAFQNYVEALVQKKKYVPDQ